MSSWKKCSFAVVAVFLVVAALFVGWLRGAELGFDLLSALLELK